MANMIFGLISAEAEHAIDSEVIVEAQQSDRQIFRQRLEVNGKVGCQGGFSNATFFTRDGDDIRAGHRLSLTVVVIGDCLSAVNARQDINTVIVRV